MSTIWLHVIWTSCHFVPSLSIQMITDCAPLVWSASTSFLNLLMLCRSSLLENIANCQSSFIVILQERLGVEEKKPSLGQFKRQSVGGQDGPKPKKAKHEGHFEYLLWYLVNCLNEFPGPAEDYSKKAVKAIAKEEESAKVKALKASAKGTKSIASFFAKKTWKTLPRKPWSILNGTCSLLPY